MPAQISDTVVYRGAEYHLSGIDGEGLFEPQPYGTEPRMISTACWRDSYCTYRVGGDELPVTEVHVGLRDEDAPLEVPVSFTGGLLLGRGFIC